jgi:hypothetical protein
MSILHEFPERGEIEETVGKNIQNSAIDHGFPHLLKYFALLLLKRSKTQADTPHRSAKAVRAQS